MSMLVDFTEEDKVPLLSEWDIKERLKSGRTGIDLRFSLPLGELLDLGRDGLYHFVCDKVTGFEQSLEEERFTAISAEDDIITIHLSARLDFEYARVAHAMPPEMEYEGPEEL